MSSPSLKIFKNAPRVLLGAFFMLSSCENQKQENSPSVPQTQAENRQSPSLTKSLSSLKKPAPKQGKQPAQEKIRFLSYNLKNYLTMEIFRKGGLKEKRSKDPREIDALIHIITHENPQILGICEIGTPEDLSDLQARLKMAGLDLPHRVHAGGFDPVRHLAILSAYPILKNNSVTHLPFQIGKSERLMGRGILSVLIDLPLGPTHFIGLHLKSKRPLKNLDQAEIRLSEARLAKAHCNAILETDPSARLVVYGDINDTRKTPTLFTLTGRSNSHKHLADVFVKDSRDHLWTHYWAYQQQYARLDYVFTSRAMTPFIDLENSYLSDHDRWNQASDHRAVLVTFQTHPHPPSKK